MVVETLRWLPEDFFPCEFLRYDVLRSTAQIRRF